MWKLLQITVGVATGCALIYWQQQDPSLPRNGYVVAGLSIGAAWLATMAIWLPMELVRWLRRRQQARSHQGLNERVPRRGAGRVGNQILPRDAASEIGPRNRVVDGAGHQRVP